LIPRTEIPGSGRFTKLDIHLIKITPLELREKIEKQLTAGFQSNEIYKNLLGDGHSKEDIDSELGNILVEKKKSRQIKPTNILFGVIFLLVIFFRVIRFSNSSGNVSIIAFISIITGIGVCIYFFTKRG
jgi:hypothetical protein